MVYSRTAVSTLIVAASWWVLVSLCSGETKSFVERPDPLLTDRLFTTYATDTFLTSEFVSGLGVPATQQLLDPEAASSGTAPGVIRYQAMDDDGDASAEITDDSNDDWLEDSDDSRRFAVRVFHSDRNAPSPSDNGDWQILPEGLLYRSYLAGFKESRHQWVNLYDTKNKERIWEATLGGRVGLLRSGSVGPVNPEGFQLDLEGAVMARVLPDEESSMLAGSDYRVGLQGTWKQGRTAWRAGYYHISSHVGDEFLIADPGFDRVNYVRDSLIAGTTYDLTPNTQVYGEIGLAVGREGGADWLEFQYGAQWAPPASNGLRGAPFAATNVYTRQDFNWISGINTVAGWGWQGSRSKHRLRIGAQHYNGPSQQFSFVNRWENLIGGGIWFDY
ncbi:MAG: DUF1207 domain-containing protein [Planctomyces sp.]